MSKLRGRSILSVADLSVEELELILRVARTFKDMYYAGVRKLNILNGKSIALIFQKPSTRTRVSMEVAVHELGGYPIYLSWSELQLARGEPIKDTARVLSRYVSGIGARVYDHKHLEELAAYSSVPVINLLSNLEHPLQAIADVFTIIEKKGSLNNLKIVFIGDGSSNVAHSLILAVTMLGGKIVVACPKQYRPRNEIIQQAQMYKGVVEIVEDPYEAVRGADVVYTDVWVSMGEEAIAEIKRKVLRPYQVSEELMKYAKKDAIFMHCLPAVRGEEVTDEVIEGKWSVVWDQAENRLHTAKAVLALVV